MILFAVIVGAPGLWVMHRAAELGDGSGLITGSIFVALGLLLLALEVFATIHLKERK